MDIGLAQIVRVLPLRAPLFLFNYLDVTDYSLAVSAAELNYYVEHQPHIGFQFFTTELCPGLRRDQDELLDCAIRGNWLEWC